MHWYQAALLVGAAVTVVVAWNVPRAVFWVALGALSFVSSSWWHDAGLPYGAAFGALTNLAICLLLYAAAEQRWEMRLWNVFHLMIVIDVLSITGAIGSHYQFAVALELANWLGLSIIFTTGWLERAGRHGGIPDSGHRSGVLGALRRALWAPRSRPPFWHFP
jgi:hypothetical protein